MKTTKIVVGGPPQSGKSRFIAGLRGNFSRDEHYLFRACPDGEGTWTYKSAEAASYRRKGTFSSENVDWYVQSLHNCTLAPLVLVDIGGIPSDENRRICAECDMAIILCASNKAEEIATWEKFFQSVGVEILTIVVSDLYAKEDTVEESKLVCHFLDREASDKELAKRPAICRVAEIIRQNINQNQNQTKKDKNMNTTIKIAELAQALGKTETEKTLPNGRVIKTIEWEGSDLLKVAEQLHNNSAAMSETVDIDGGMPAWLATAVVHEVHPRHARLNSPDGFVGIGCQRPSGNGSGPMDWKVEELPETGNGRRTVKVEFALDPSRPFTVEELDAVTPPEVGLGDVVILSGRGPLWLTASIAMAFHGRCAAVACFQPGTGATVALTHAADVPLGSLIQA